MPGKVTVRTIETLPEYDYPGITKKDFFEYPDLVIIIQSPPRIWINDVPYLGAGCYADMPYIMKEGPTIISEGPFEPKKSIRSRYGIYLPSSDGSYEVK